MDGWLLFIEDGDDDDDEIERAAIVETMDSKLRAMFEEVRDSRLTLATWEMESLITGSPEVMAAVHNLGEFSWTLCPANDCTTNIKRKNIKEKVNQAGIGPDAQTPPWSLPGPVTRRVTRSVAAQALQRFFFHLRELHVH